MNKLFRNRTPIAFLILSTLLLSFPVFAQAPLKGKAVVIYPSADLWSLKTDKSMVWLESLSAGQELKILSSSEKGSLKGEAQSLMKVRLDSGKEGYVIESFVAKEPLLGAVTSSMANLYSQARDTAVLPAILPLGSFVALWPVEGKPDFYQVSAYVKSAGALYANKFILAADLSTRVSDVNAALLLAAAEGADQAAQKQKALETIDKKYADTALSALVENLRRAIVPLDQIPMVGVLASFAAKAPLNIRERPSTGAKVVMMLKAKDAVTADARLADKAIVGSDTDYWYRTVSPVQGWVFGAFLAEAKPVVAPLPSPSPVAAASPAASPPAVAALPSPSPSAAASPAASPPALASASAAPATAEGAAVQGLRSANFSVGPFEASYFSKKALVKTELKPRVSLTYAGWNFLNIDSKDLSAVWKGSLEAFDREQAIDINMEIMQAEATVKIDGVTVATGLWRSRTIPYRFSQGKHQIEIDFENHYHVTQFNVSFTQTPSIGILRATSIIASLPAGAAKILSASASESGNADGEIGLSLEDQSGPIFMTLDSSAAVHWRIDNPSGAAVLGIFLKSYEPLSTVAIAGDVPVYAYNDSAFRFADQQRGSPMILELFGWPPSQMVRDVAPKSLSFPASKNRPQAAAATPSPARPSGLAYVPGDPRDPGIKGFYISKTEVTQAEWEEAMGANPCSLVGRYLPVGSVSWFDAVAFCNKKSQAEGLRPAYSIRGDDVSCDWSAEGYRLPTENEWDRAAAGAEAGKASAYSGSALPNEVAWTQENADYQAHAVGQKKPNGLGLFDMSGNLAEWCWDWWGESPGAARGYMEGPETGSFSLLKGGSYRETAESAKVKARSAYDPFLEDVSIGFRVVRPEKGGSGPVITRSSPKGTAPSRTARQAMAYIPGGTFTMGNTAATPGGTPPHTATVSVFSLSTTELTQGEYLKFCQETGEHYPDWMMPGKAYDADNVRAKFYNRLVGPGRDSFPILGVSWYDAIAYCNWKSKKDGLTPVYKIGGKNVDCDWSANGYRLPTETEWEYAAKAGGAERALPYAGSAKIEEAGWFYDNCDGGTHPVGEKKPNGFGLFDMSGNAFEWCWDWYGPVPGDASVDYRGPAAGEQRVIKGGSFLGSFWTVLMAGRSMDYPGSTEYNVGFRLARGFSSGSGR
jgi:formylglycine-generating enzyme